MKVIYKITYGGSLMKQVAKYTSDILSAMVFYPEDKSDHSFQIHVNRPELSFGYFFSDGGDIIEVENYIAEFTIEGYNDKVYISLNRQQILRVEINNGNTIETINIDSFKLFAFVFPKNIGNLTFFDINNNVVNTINHRYLKNDFYTKTRILFSSNYSNNPTIVRALITSFIEFQNQGVNISREVFVETTKYMNVLGGTYILDYFTEEELVEKITKRIRVLLSAQSKHSA